MIARQLVAELARVLEGQVDDARAEARDIVAALLDVSRLWPSANGDAVVGSAIVAHARDAASRRARGEPFAYAVGRASFRYLTLLVDHRVLIPRQETEILVDIVLRELGSRRGGVAADIGTGSGAIALALASESALERVIATDVSRDALDVARANRARLATRLRAAIDFREGDGLLPVLDMRLDAVVANPPYIRPDEAAELPASVRDWEPALALFAEEEGMRNIATLVRDAPGVLVPGGLLALEVDSRRADAAAELARRDGRYVAVAIHPDLAGRDRVLTARRAPDPR